jgi:hypothetical protein
MTVDKQAYMGVYNYDAANVLAKTGRRRLNQG